MSSSRKDRAIARRTFLGFAAAFTTAGVVGSITTDNVAARSAFDTSLADWMTASEAADDAVAAWTAAQQDAVISATEASRVLEVTNPEMIDDPNTLTALQSRLDELAESAELTIHSPGDVTAQATEPSPRETPGSPEGRTEQLGAAEELAAKTAGLTDQTTGLMASVAAVESQSSATVTAIEAVVASAAAKGAATEPPTMASQATKDAYTAAVAALTGDESATASSRIAAYQDAWTAARTSHEEAEAAASRGNGSSGDGVEPTYVNGILVVNKTYALPSWYGNGLTGETAAGFESMRAEAASLGLNLWIASGFRSYATQVAVYNRWVSQEGVAGADRHSARPGHSEHQSGLAFDLNTISEAFGHTPEGQWVAANAHRFGFIVRYPQGKEGVTGYIWEPWHLRYLGVATATAVYNSGLSLEEYLGVTSVYD